MLTAFAVPGALVWAVIGLALGHGGATAVAGVTLAYLALAAVCEGLMLPLRVPQRAWQVPDTWIVGGPLWRQVVTWGACLGPCVFTRNPYGSWLGMVTLVAVAGAEALPVAVLAGCAHGVGRAAGILGTAVGRDADDHFALFARRTRWRVLDGYAAATVAAFCAVMLIGR